MEEACLRIETCIVLHLRSPRSSRCNHPFHLIRSLIQIRRPQGRVKLQGGEGSYRCFILDEPHPDFMILSTRVRKGMFFPPSLRQSEDQSIISLGLSYARSAPDSIVSSTFMVRCALYKLTSKKRVVQ
jgi:hypothetical protein